MVQGLLMELEDYNCWSIAVAAGYRGPHLLSRAVWDEQQVLDEAAVWAVRHLDDRDAVLIVDETADEKSSPDCAGAARQYPGAPRRGSPMTSGSAPLKPIKERSIKDSVH
jgi:SRSO17 transposase